MIIDTSIWVRHLRFGEPRLRQMLHDDLVWIHPFIIGELACGGIRNRREILGLLSSLPLAIVAEHAEVMAMIEAKQIHGKGIGWVDAHLLASARISNLAIWTGDRRLHEVAVEMGVAV